MKAHQPGRKQVSGRPQGGRNRATPRSSPMRESSSHNLERPPHGARVNQKMVNGMIARRVQGFTHAQIAAHYQVSPRTVRRHTKGVSPRLVHAGDPKGIDLLTWCAMNIFAVKERLKLNVQETDVAVRKAREEVSKLDPLTKQRLERDRKMRIDFLFNVALPSAAPEIRSMRFIERIEREFGPLDRDRETAD